MSSAFASVFASWGSSFAASSFVYLASPLFLALGSVTGIGMAFAIGSNDAANSVGTVVGARALSIKKALLLGAVFEFAGAMLVGQFVAATIRKGVIDPNWWSQEPNDLMNGLFSALLGATVWLIIATFLSLPVSTTHSIVGGLVGFGLLDKGWKSLNHMKLLSIVLSWIVSPLAGFLVAAIVYYFTLVTIVRSRKLTPKQAAFAWAPVHVGVCIAIFVVFIVESGLKSFHIEFPIWASILIGIGAGVVMIFVTQWKVVPYYRRQDELEAKTANLDEVFVPEAALGDAGVFADGMMLDTIDGPRRSLVEEEEEKSLADEERRKAEATLLKSKGGVFFKLKKKLLRSRGLTKEALEKLGDKTSRDADELSEYSWADSAALELERLDAAWLLDESDSARKRLGKAEKKRLDVEAAQRLFDHELDLLGRKGAVPIFFGLSIMSAAFVAFAHAANDLANATGPFVGIVYQLSPQTQDKSWVEPVVTAVAALTMDLGLFLFGKRVLQTVGRRISALTPTAGYVAQFAVALVAIISSRLALPISTTHVLIGAVTGIGFARLGLKGVKWFMLFKIVISWIITLPISGATAILVYFIFEFAYKPILYVADDMIIRTNGTATGSITGL